MRGEVSQFGVGDGNQKEARHGREDGRRFCGGHGRGRGG